jgi:hypothetical protein
VFVALSTSFFMFLCGASIFPQTGKIRRTE